MQITQFAAKYLPEEDRILLRIGIGDEREAQVWITRRLVKLMWPILGRIAAQLVPSTIADRSARKEAAEFQREAGLQSADFRTRYEGGRTPVWAGGPVVATELQLKQLPDGMPVLSMGNREGAGIDLPMDAPMHAGFCELLRKAAVESGWDLSLEYGARTKAPDARLVH